MLKWKKWLGCLPGRHHNTTTILREGSSLRLPFRLWTQHLPVSVIFFIFLPIDTTFADVRQFFSSILCLFCLWTRRLYSYVLWWESSLCKTPHFQWIYGKLNQIYEKLRSDQMDPKSALGGPKPIARTGRSLLKNWSYTSNQCIYFSILLDWRAHLAKTLFIPHKYIKCALL